jgi:TrmH family RNA methyltransferase
MNEAGRITSRDNQKLKYVRRVRDGKLKEAVFVEGIRHAEEVLRAKTAIIECFCSETFGENERERKLIGKIKAENAGCFIVDNRVFPSIAETNAPQGIILIVRKPSTTKENFDCYLGQSDKTNSPIVFLSEINNPSNLGAILRTAEAAGAAGVVISTKSADAFSPKSMRSALGANLRLPIWADAEFEEVLVWANEKGVITTAADINAEKKYTEIDWAMPRILIFGSEAHGLSENAREKIDELIYIPMENDVESLNIAVSCGIILFEARRVRRAG